MPEQFSMVDISNDGSSLWSLCTSFFVGEADALAYWLNILTNTS